VLRKQQVVQQERVVVIMKEGQQDLLVKVEMVEDMLHLPLMEEVVGGGRWWLLWRWRSEHLLAIT